MTMRLSIIALAGMARTLVAVGTSSDASMLRTTAAAGPRNTCFSSSAPLSAVLAGVAGFTAGFFSCGFGAAGAAAPAEESPEDGVLAVLVLAVCGLAAPSGLAGSGGGAGAGSGGEIGVAVAAAGIPLPPRLVSVLVPGE